MSEAYGTVIIKAPEPLLSSICEDDELVPKSAMSQLLEFSGIDLKQSSLSTLHASHKEFYHEGIEQSDDMAIITIFGDDWMYLLEVIVNQGQDIEAYGEIVHEHGAVGFFVLNKDGKTLCKVVDYEDADEPSNDEEKVREEMRSLLPEVVALYFERSDDEDQEDDEDSEFDEDGWEPISLTETIQRRGEPDRVMVHWAIYYHPDYSWAKLQEAIERGGNLIDPGHKSSGLRVDYPSSLLNEVITNPEIESYRLRKTVIEDILSLNLIDLNEVYAGYDNSVGTPLYLAADEGLHEIVEMLIDQVEDKNPAHPLRNDQHTALDAARFCRALTPKEGYNYPKVIELLKRAN